MSHKDPIKHREYQREYQKLWRINNHEKWSKILDASDKKRKSKPKRIIQLREVRARRHHRFKVYVLELYGKRCVYCNEKKYEALCVDHIKDNGAEHRKSEKYRRLNLGGMWGYLAKTEFRPDEYQILCYNCNLMKLHYKIVPTGNQPKSFDWWKEFSKLKYKK